MTLIKYKIEVCVDDFDSAMKATKAGANRLEVCSSLIEGGVTPAYSLMKEICTHSSKKVYIMIRPRSGDFLYSVNDFNLMKIDIQHAKEAGAHGVVFGVLNKDGSVDVQKNKELIDLAAPMEVTFHRAFDLTPDPFLAMEEIISLGVQTILTSGQAQSAEDGLEVIRELIKRAENRIEIMVGGGINPSNIFLLKEAGATTFHFTCRKIRKSSNTYESRKIKSLNSNVLLNPYQVYEFDMEKFNNIKSALKQ